MRVFHRRRNSSTPRNGVFSTKNSSYIFSSEWARVLASVLCSSENVDENYLGGTGKLVRAFEEILENPARKLGGTAGHMEHGWVYERMKTQRKEKRFANIIIKKSNLMSTNLFKMPPSLMRGV